MTTQKKATLSEPYGIHWFRRDLRIAGNAGLKFNWTQSKGRTLGLFCFDSNFLSRSDFSSNRFQFFLETLKELKIELQEAGGDLLVLNAPPLKAFNQLFDTLKKSKVGLPQLITWNKDYEPFARQRDKTISEYLISLNILHETFRDHLILEPHELVKNGTESEGYQVYSPFARKWCELIKTNNDYQSRLNKKNLGFEYIENLLSKKVKPFFKLTWKNLLKDNTPKDHLEDFIRSNQKNVSIEIPDVGLKNALERLTEFKSKIKNYGKDRDIPSLFGTSKMSMFLKNGSITSAQIIAHLNLKPFDGKAITGAEKYLNEIIWREFYYHILFRRPEVENESFNPKYKNLKWQNNESWFEAWKEGQTGFPIVDAGMRELKKTGWMHNRVRMIVASFLTKDLLIDWRWGEKYFMEALLDGDLAPNNGGWQWAASTGCDPQPYFRIFNPWSQSEKFDPNGDYIKKYIPELKDCDPKDLHKESALRPANYPRPLVDHSKQRLKALELYKKA